LMLEPAVSVGEQQGVLRVVEPVSKVAERFQWGLLVARDDFIVEHPTLLRKLLRGYIKGAEYCVNHADETAAMVCDTMPGSSPSAVERAVARTLPIWNTTGSIDLPGLAVASETMHALGAVPEKIDPKTLVDLSGLSKH